MAQTNPFDQFDAPAASGAQAPAPVIYSPPKEPKEPKEPPVTYTPLSDSEAAAMGYPTNQKYQRSSRGEISAISGTKDAGGSDGVQEKARTATLNSIVDQVNRTQDLYNKGIRDETLWNGFGALDSVGPGAAQFNTAGQGVADQGLAAFRVPGIGAQSDMEAKQFATANTPQAGDWDTAIEEKLSNIRRRVDANRAAMGLPPANWTGLSDMSDSATSDRKGSAAALTSGEPGGGGNPNLPDGGPPAFGSGMNAGGQIAGNTHVGGGDGAQQIARNSFTTEDNPDLVSRGVRAEYTKRLARGDSAASLVAWSRSAGIDPSAIPSIQAQVQYRDRNPNVGIGEFDTSKIDDRIVPISGAGQAINAIGTHPAGTYAINAADAATGFNLDSAAGALGGNAEQVRRGIEASSTENPNAALAGTVSGGVMTSLLGEQALAAKGVTGLRGALAADAAYGGLAGAGATDYSADGTPATLADRALGGAKGAGAGLAGSYLGSKAGSTLSSLARGISEPAVSTLQREGVPLTVGQQLGTSGRIGEGIKGVEDRLSGLPGFGDVIKARQAEGIEGFNRAAFNRALKPIGGDIGSKTGSDAMVAADDAVSSAYQKALNGKFAQADPQFGTDLSNAVAKTLQLPRVGDEVANGIAEILQPYMTGNGLSGEAMQQISRELRDLKAGYRSDPLKRRIGSAIDDAEEAIFGVFRRNAPDVVPEYEKARTAARRLYILENATLRGKEGIFTPSQLRMAERQGMRNFEGSRATARGEGPFNDLYTAGESVLPSSVPDSGTAGRILLPALLLGGGAGADYATDSNGKLLTLGALVAGAYSRAGQRVLTKGGRGVESAALRNLLDSDATRRGLQVLPSTGAAVAATRGNQ